MCGITGIVSNSAPESSELLYSMTTAIEHRGPDDSGYYENRLEGGLYVGLGHRRLSIIDLDSGKQPMSNETNELFLVFNGEIYNFEQLRKELCAKGHSFKTKSDSEVIIHAFEEYGYECLNHFRGMFAFAIWDNKEKKLFIARDRFGKKPLFYAENENGFYFASEIKALLALPNLQKVFAEEELANYLVYRYVPGPKTLYKGIQKLAPGSYAVYKNGILTQKRYYYPPDRNAIKKAKSIVDPTKEFLNELREAVRLRMVSDVPYGAFLSGGIDSSAIVGLMTEFSQQPVKTFSVGFRESSYSELEYAAVIARRFSTDHKELVVSYDELIEHLPSLIRYRDAPVSEPSDIPIYLLAKEASKSVKMVLTGEGSDELLGGYPKHVFERYVVRYQYLPKFVRHYVIEPVVQRLPYKFRRAKTAVATMGIEKDCERLPRWFGAISYKESAEFTHSQNENDYGQVRQPPYDYETNNSALRKILYFDQVSWLPDNLLERGDRMTMAASIEARMPFLDHKLAELVSGLPDRYRVRGMTTKWILREAVKNFIPENILNRPKVGFRLPVNEWFKGPLKDYLESHLLGRDSITKQLYRSKKVENTIREHTQGRHNHEKLLWTLLNLELWAKENPACFE